MGDAKRIFRGIELIARKQFSTELWAQMSFLYSSLKGNYSGAIREASGQTDPGINADYDYYQFTFNDYGNLELDRPVQVRIDAVYNAPFGLSMGARVLRPLRSPGLAVRLLQQLLPGPAVPRHARNEHARVLLDNRTPTDYDLNLSLGYNINVGPVTITPQAYLFNVINRQTATSYDATFNPGGSFVTDPTSPFYGQAGSGAWRGNLPGGRRGALPGQHGLPEGQPAQQPAASPRGAQGHLLRSFPGSFSGAASAAPFFCLGPIRKIQAAGSGFKGTGGQPFGTTPVSCLSSVFSAT